MKQRLKTKRIRFGPLHYQFEVYDPWGEEMLLRLEQNLDCNGFSGPPERIIHLLELHPNHLKMTDDRLFRLPEKLQCLLSAKIPCENWRLADDDTGHVCWDHSQTRHTFWTFPTATPHAHASFQIPWQPLLKDIIDRKGAIFHGGLSGLNNQWFLFTAPPDGGKTTALSRLPPVWEILADDAVLVWPDKKNSYWASPLPTWGNLIQTSTRIQSIKTWRVGHLSKIGGIFFLIKASREKLTRLESLRATAHAFRAISEHPRVLNNRDFFKKQLFATAWALSKKTVSWELALTKNGFFWETIYIELPHLLKRRDVLV